MEQGEAVNVKEEGNVEEEGEEFVQDSNVGDNIEYPSDPFTLWAEWYKLALMSTNIWAHNFVLSTCGKNMQVQSRTVSLHKWDSKGFVFCSNYEGPKANELNENPCAAILFQWPELLRQVRMTGTVAKAPPDETEELFKKCRPVEQAMFFANSGGKDHPFNQSNVIKSRKEERIEHLKKVLADYTTEQVPLPKAWGAFRFTPSTMEFIDISVPFAERVKYIRTTSDSEKSTWELQLLMN